MSLPVIISPQAIAQLDALGDYAAQFSATGRSSLLAAVTDKVVLLEAQPELYPVSQRPPLRRCVVTRSVSLYYRIQPAAIEIVGFIDSRSDPSALELPA